MDHQDESKPITDAVSFSQRTGGPGKARMTVIGGAAIALAVGAVATSMAASPFASDPSGTSPDIGLIYPSAVMTDPAELGVPGSELGRFGGPMGLREISITSISGSSVSLATEDGWTRTITLTEDVALTRGGQEIEASELAVGDQVRLAQTRSDDGVYTVTAIAVVVPHIAGEVSDLTATGFTITTRDGSVWSITTDADTIYRYGLADGTAADVANGDEVLVQGESTGDNALDAASVTVPGDRVGGTVTATTSNSITIETRDGDSVTIHVDSDTIYRLRTDDDTEATLADIAVGDVVGAAGRERSDGSLDAAVVAEGRVGHGEFPGRGFHGNEPDESTDES